MMIKGFASLVVLGIVIYKTGSVFWGVISLAITWAVVLIIYDRHNSSLIFQQNTQQDTPRSIKKQLLPSWDWMVLAKLIWLALPLGFVMMFQSLSSNIPRIMIEGNLGQYALGIFSAIAYIQMVGTTVVGALGESASPRLADHYAAGNHRAFSALLIRLTVIGILLGLVGLIIALLAGRQILTIIYRAEYVEYNLFILLMLVGGISYLDSFLGYGITAARYFRIQTLITFLYALIVTILCFWLIPLSGLQGAAYALIIAGCIKVVFYLLITFYVIKASQRKQTSWRSYILEQS
jgi:O-antigen/teichoic acid export membrane protein